MVPDLPNAPPGGTAMLREAKEAPEAVARLVAKNESLCHDLGARLRAAPPPFAVTCARGSSDNAATFAKYLFEIHLGLVTASVGPSVTSIYAARPRMRGALFLALSQSGRSPDLLNLAEAARDDGALTVAAVNDAASRSPPCARSCFRSMPGPSGASRRRNPSSPRSPQCSSSSRTGRPTAISLAALERLPDTLRQAARQDWSAALPLLSQADNLFVVGRGSDSRWPRRRR